MGYTVEMEKFRFEHANNNGDNHHHNFTPEEMKIRLTVDEIRGQLSITEDRYEEAIERLKGGDTIDMEYLATYQGNLIDWMNAIKIAEGTIKRENEEVLNEVERRLFLISEEMERNIH